MKPVNHVKCGLSAAGLGLSLVLAGGCDIPPAGPPDPDPDPDPACTFKSEVQVASETFVRVPGNPWRHTTVFTDEGDYALEFHLEHLPAAEAILDGQKLNLSAGVSVQDVVVHRVELHLTAGAHELSLRVAGPPGGKLSYTLARIVAADGPAIVDEFTVQQGVDSFHTLCGGPSYIAFGADALQPEDAALKVTARCEAAACAAGGEALASPRLVFETPGGGYQFRTAPMLVHATAPHAIRELDGVPIAGEVVGSVVLDGATADVVRSRIPHFSTVEDRALEPWCAEQLAALGEPASYLCYSAGDDPGMQYLALCKKDMGGDVTATEVVPCGPGPDACKVGDDTNDSCNPGAADCAVLAKAALTIDPCPKLPDDTEQSAAHQLRCTAATNQVFVGDENPDTHECELKGDEPLTREQQVKTVLAATFGANFMAGVEHYLATDEACKKRDFSEFKDYDEWAGDWSASVLKFAICVEILQGREEPGGLVIAPRAKVLEGEMTAMLARAGGVAPLALADDPALAPHAHVVALHQRHEELKNGDPPLRELVNLDCPKDAWFLEVEDPVLQAAVDRGVTCDPHPLAPMTRAQTAEWLHRLILAPTSCAEAKVEVSCAGAVEPGSGEYPSEQICQPCNSIESCQTIVDSLIPLFPDYAATAAGRTIKIKARESGFNCDGYTTDVILCGKAMIEGGKYVTNKLLFHELNHHLQARKVEYSKTCDSESGNCAPSEFQASLLEDFYFPDTCSGGSYMFTDTNGVTRASADVLEVLGQAPTISESELWDYAMGRIDTLASYMTRFELAQTFELFHSQDA